MAKRRSPVKPGQRQRAPRDDRHVGAAEFKARCLELMDRVQETGEPYVVTRHGEPVAKLVRYAQKRGRPLFGSMTGTVLEYVRPFDPIEGEWEINRH